MVLRRECGFAPFLPGSLVDTMKQKDLRKTVTHYFKQNSELCPSKQKHLTSLQVSYNELFASNCTSSQCKLHYVSKLNELRSFGGKLFLATLVVCQPVHIVS